MPCGAITSERVAKVAPVTRSAAMGAGPGSDNRSSDSAAQNGLTGVIITPEKVDH
jgi:hypothetical protein